MVHARTLVTLALAPCLLLFVSINARSGEAAGQSRPAAAQLMGVLQDGDTLWQQIAEFTDHYPRRLSGTQNLERGIDWLVERLKRDGWDVRTQPAMVPVWVRGKEWCRLVEGGSPHAMPMVGLGGSVSTGGKPLRAEVLVVTSMDDLKANAEKAKGRIVVWNVPFVKYSETVSYRYKGPSEAARYGAVASLVRSIGPYGMQTPHTGNSSYNDSLTKIPAGAITMEDAMLLQRLQDRGEHAVIELYMEGETKPDAPSRNIVFEIKGSEKPEEVVVMGGHIDSWDVGTGAMDDASGAFTTWRALHVIRRAGLKPKRTLRVCFWTNEENGLRGGKAYAEQTKNEKHFAGIEMDGGAFQPKGFSGAIPEPLLIKVKDVMTGLLQPVGATEWKDGEGGADTGPLHELGVPVLELEVDNSKYFWYHHTEADTIDKLDPQDLNKCVYAVAVMAYALAGM
jgi:carboxypeptidase Q